MFNRVNSHKYTKHKIRPNWVNYNRCIWLYLLNIGIMSEQNKNMKNRNTQTLYRNVLSFSLFK